MYCTRTDLRKSSFPLSAGFTVLELIVAMTIVAVMLALGVPALRDLLVSQKVRQAANDLYSDLTYARSEAIKRNAQVQVIRQSSAWTGGWTVEFTGNALRSQTGVPNVSYAGSADSMVTYNPDGRTTLSGTTSFNFLAPDAGAVSMRCVVIAPSGRPSVLVDSNRNGNCRDG
jgi:type IV fimbrial biogenesis protein FimT